MNITLNHKNKKTMTQNQEKVLKMNVELLEMLMQIHNEKDQTFFSDDTKEALLITICATNAVIRSMKKTQTINIKAN